MKVVFLIINYNDYETTSILLNKIKDYFVLDKIVVVDNKSTDTSYEKLKENYSLPKISIIQNESNKGYAAGINLGSKFILKECGYCNIIISNSDIVIDSEVVIQKLINSKKEDCAIIAPIIKEHHGLNRGWKVPTPLQDALLNIIYIHKYLRPKLLFYKEAYYKQPLVEVDAVSGCFFMIDAKYLEKVDYFDENTFLYYEENIIAKKMQMIHKKIMVNTEVEVFHNHSITIDKSINHRNKYKELKKSQYYFQVKYNHASMISRVLLKITDKTSYFLLSILKF